ncbi:hypothetical protein ACFXJJ_21730 [Streptomyces sp. NPDC059233]
MTLYFDAAAALFQVHPSCNGRWEDRLWLNVPGPVYGAETDNCATGRLEAPRNGDDLTVPITTTTPPASRVDNTRRGG